MDFHKLPRQHITALLTSHNRVAKTLKSLKCFFAQSSPRLELSACLVDAGSTDSTATCVARSFPQTRLVETNEHVFWCQGMRLAYSRAIAEPYDYLLWLNDDTFLEKNALETLRFCMLEKQEPSSACIVVGSVRDPLSGLHTYGGKRQLARQAHFRWEDVIPANTPQTCDTFNGNCVLISRSASIALGNLNSSFTHALGDLDYGLRARKTGIPCLVAPGYLAFCPRNDPTNSWTNPSLPFLERWRRLHSAKGPPPKEWIRFARLHAGRQWPIYALKLYGRLLFPKLWELRSIHKQTQSSPNNSAQA
jgi:GT2 family glycosyltransferase